MCIRDRIRQDWLCARAPKGQPHNDDKHRSYQSDGEKNGQQGTDNDRDDQQCDGDRHEADSDDQVSETKDEMRTLSIALLFLRERFSRENDVEPGLHLLLQLPLNPSSELVVFHSGCAQMQKTKMCFRKATLSPESSTE